MIELYLSKNNNEISPSFGKYYPRVSYKQTLNIHEMAVHMAEHNTPFSEGTIEGILRDFVKCTREQTLMGNTVKVDNLAIFKVSVIGNGSVKLYDVDTDKVISASIGVMKKTDKTGPAVQSLKLLAQATGDYTREELNKDGRLAWTDRAQALIAEAKAGNGYPTSPVSGGDSNSNGGGGENTNNSNGSNGGNGGGSQNQEEEGVMAPQINGENPFAESTEVTIQGPQGASVYYTTDGSTPTSESTLYSAAFTLTESTTIKAIAILNGESSEVSTRAFSKSSGGSGGGSFDTGS